MRILESDVTFGDSQGSGGKHYQDILAHGKVIGCLYERERGLLAPIETLYCVCVPEAKAEKCPRWIESEDEGQIIALFEDFDQYLQFVNEEVVPVRF